MSRHKSAIALALWAAVITVTSHGRIDSRDFVHTISTQSHVVSESAFSAFWSKWWWLFVKGWHVAEFCLLTLLLLANLPRKARYASGLGLAILLAALDEWHQTIIPYRGGRVSDVAIDCIGVVLALLFAWWWESGKPSKGFNESTLQTV